MQSGKSFARGIRNFGLWNLEFNSWNPELSPRKPESKFNSQGIRNPVSRVQNLQRGIQDRRLSWFTWGEMSKTLGSLSNTFLSNANQPEVGFFHFWTITCQNFQSNRPCKGKEAEQYKFISSRHIKRKKASLPVDVRRLQTFLL